MISRLPPKQLKSSKHAARNSRCHALADELQHIAAEHPNIRTHFRYDAPLLEDVVLKCCDSVGLVNVAFLKEFLPSSDAEYYFCGPKPFMAGLYHGLLNWGVSESHINFEFFGPKQDISGDGAGSSKRQHRRAQASLSSHDLHPV